MVSEARVLDNGNINIKFNTCDLEDINVGRCTPLDVLSEVIFWADCLIIGDTYALSNFDARVTVYNTNRDVQYILALSDIDNVLMQGRTLKLCAIEIDGDAREEINEWLES